MGGISAPGVAIGQPITGSTAKSVLTTDAANVLANIQGVAGQVVGFDASNIPAAVTISSGLTVGSTAIASGAATRLLYENSANVLQENAYLTYVDTNAANYLTVGRSSANSNLQLGYNALYGAGYASILAVGNALLTIDGRTLYLNTTADTSVNISVNNGVVAQFFNLAANTGGISFATLNPFIDAFSGPLSFMQNQTTAGQLTAAKDWWLGASDPGGSEKVRVNGAIRVATYAKITPVTVATLPAAATAGAGAIAVVNDALAPAYGAAVAGGGAVVCQVISTGAAWNVS